uniref:Uncharacterized protein n=1 Tax=Romanomermis culicivorax TaxID=13658 RepID=A0A915ICJ3_ROMCU
MSVDNLHKCNGNDITAENQIIPRHLIKRNDPFKDYSDTDFNLEYRFNKETVHEVIIMLYEKLKNATNRHNSLPS